MNRVAAPMRPESAPDTPMSGEKSIDESAQWASELAIAVTAMNRRNLAEPKRRAIGGPKATSQTQFSITCVQDPCRKA